MEDEEQDLPDEEENDVSGDRSFERDRAVKAWYLFKRRRKRQEEEEA